jgi:hypothetical protein
MIISSTPANTMNDPIVIHHNLDPNAFLWLWGKYVTAPVLTKHCTACLKSLGVSRHDGRLSPYSQKFSRASNPRMASEQRLVMDENEARSFAAIYLCGVSAAGYARKTNYPHNLHAAIVPSPGQHDTFRFENWVIEAENGTFTTIPSRQDLAPEFHHLPDAFTTCRIFRWAAGILPQLTLNQQ